MELVDKKYFENLQVVHHQSKAASNEIEYSEVGNLITVGRSSGKHAHEILEGVKAVIRNAPTVDAEPVKHGRWEGKFWTDSFQHVCSLCGSTSRVHPESAPYKYCPYCGAKMDKE